MKAFKASILFLTVGLAFNACVKDNRDDCPEGQDYNLSLYFEYYNNGGEDLFAENIEAIDLLIFDENLFLYQQLSLDEVIDHPERRRELYVEPGTYYIISWANNFGGRSRIGSGSRNLDDNYVYLNYSQLSSDRLYYAPDKRGLTGEQADDLELYKIEVAPVGITYDTVSFMSAHRTTNVYLKGFTEIEDQQRRNPDVYVRNLTCYYDFFLHRSDDNSVEYSKAAQEITIEEDDGRHRLYGFARFYVPHFDNESPVNLDIARILSSGVEESYRIDMNDILEELDMEVWDGDEAVIDILIEAVGDGTYVVAKVPDWTVVDVRPGFN
ncbi:MAG: FimB/Mfa2 family fimbrial subunit [Alistipes sp.]|nr:FimB/Mfa2 family fimbrial subunit [Alistipes sp.]